MSQISSKKLHALRGPLRGAIFTYNTAAVNERINSLVMWANIGLSASLRDIRSFETFIELRVAVIERAHHINRLDAHICLISRIVIIGRNN